jgi:hypothetical protein
MYSTPFKMNTLGSGKSTWAINRQFHPEPHKSLDEMFMIGAL